MTVPDEPGFDLTGLIGVLRRRLGLIIVATIVAMTVAGLVILSLKPIYTATAMVQVDPSQKNLLDPTAELLGSSSENARVEGEVELAKSETVLMRVVQDADLVNDPMLAPEPGLVQRVLSTLRLRQYVPPTGSDRLDAILDMLRDDIIVQRRGLTFLIAIQAKSADPDEAAKLANIVAKIYIAQQVEAKIDSTLASRDIIQSRVAEASTAVAASDDALDKFISANIAAISNETGRADLAGLATTIDTVVATRAKLAALADAAANSLQSRDWTALTRSLQSDALASLELRRQQVAQSIATAPDGSQVAVDLKGELAKLETDMQAAAQNQIVSLQTQVSDAQGKVSDLKAQLRSSVLGSNLSSSTLTRIYELQQSSEITRNQYQTLLTRLKDLDQQAYLQVADSRVASEALAPRYPSFPNLKLLFAVAAIGAISLAIGLAFLYENVIGGIVSEGQLLAQAGLRRVLSVPRQREGKAAGGLPGLLLTAPLSVYSEAIRKIRLAVEQGMRPRRETAVGGTTEGAAGRVVLVTSASPGEGKTTTALSLARAYALSGKTTLLIDCDLRKPSLHRQLGIEPSNGLIDYLSDPEAPPPIGSIITFERATGVGILVGSRRSETSTDQLVVSSTFGQLIRAAVEAFDIVILDTPPVGPVVDPVYLAPFADAVVFVVRWATTPQREVKSAISVLADALPPDVEITAVLNQSSVKPRKMKGYSYYYSKAT